VPGDRAWRYRGRPSCLRPPPLPHLLRFTRGQFAVLCGDRAVLNCGGYLCLRHIGGGRARNGKKQRECGRHGGEQMIASVHDQSPDGGTVEWRRIGMTRAITGRRRRDQFGGRRKSNSGAENVGPLGSLATSTGRTGFGTAKVTVASAGVCPQGHAHV